MKKLFTVTLLCGLLFFASNIQARPEFWWYTAVAYVYDHAGNPMSNIRVNLWVSAWDGETNLSGEANGYTNQYGYAIVSYLIDGEYDPELEFMEASVINPPYSTVNAIGNRSTSSNPIYPEFWIVLDQDQNGIADAWEMPLAQKFCPELFLQEDDQGVRPVPVEILDRNDDGQLGWEDIYVGVTPVGLEILTDVTADKIWINGDQWWHYSDVYPQYIPMLTSAEVEFESYTYFGMCYLIPHFEWAGQSGLTYPTTDWYDPWEQKIATYTSSSYVNGTTYAHLFKHFSEVVIQYYFFYPFNACSNRHEGDWEHINVVLNSQNPASANIQRVEYYFHHRYMNCYTPGIDYYLVNGTHPRVYVGGYASFDGLDGDGSHGSYPKAQIWDDVTTFLGIGVDETVLGDGMHINFSMYNNIIVIPNPERIDITSDLNWMRFKGLWGHIVTTPSSMDVWYSIGVGIAETILLGIDVGLPENVGNIAPYGPAYQPPWNKIGPNSGNSIYP